MTIRKHAVTAAQKNHPASSRQLASTWRTSRSDPRACDCGNPEEPGRRADPPTVPVLLMISQEEVDIRMSRSLGQQEMSYEIYDKNA